MEWDAERLREEVTVHALSDCELAARYETTAKAVEMARYRLGLRPHVRCVSCQRVVEVGEHRNARIKSCEECFDKKLALYLVSQERAEVLARRLGISKTTLVVEARARFGLTRQDVTPAVRGRIRELLRETSNDEYTLCGTPPGGVAGTD